jgi:hypothetical protein
MIMHPVMILKCKTFSSKSGKSPQSGWAHMAIKIDSQCQNLLVLQQLATALKHFASLLRSHYNSDNNGDGLIASNDLIIRWLDTKSPQAFSNLGYESDGSS